VDRFTAPLDELLADFSRGEHLISLINQIRDFGGSLLPDNMDGTDLQWPEASALWRECQNRRTDLPIMSGSLLLYLAGRFEFYIRTIIEIAAEEIASQCEKYNDLPPKLKKELIVRTAEVVQSPRRYGYDEIQVEGFILTLADGLRASSSIPSINSACLSTTDANMRPEILADLFKRIGMDNVWPEIGKQTKTKIHLRVTTDSDATNHAKSRLNDIMEDRNRIAHPTNTTTFLGPDQVLEATKFLSMLAEVMLDVLRVYMVAFANSRASV
jgi:hypothetical protein